MGNHRKYFIGQTYSVPDGDFTILELDVDTYKHAVVKWCSTGNLQRIRLDVIKLGNIKNPLHPSVEGVGYLGIGEYKANNHRRYNSWASMLARCYRKRLKEKYPTYIDCSTIEDWHNYQAYAEYYESDRFRQDGWHLDKDLLIKGNKLYSPETCIFLPKELNNSGLSFESTASKHGYKGVAICPQSGKWMSVIWSNKTLSSKTTGGRYVDIKDAAIDHLAGEIQKINFLIENYDGIIDPRGINAFYERIGQLENEMGVIK